MVKSPLPRGRGPVAITGGSGRLGASLTFYLVSAGIDVRVLDIDPPTHGIPCDFRRVDIGRDLDLRPTLEGCWALVHLAALHGPDLLKGVPRRSFWSVNVDATARALVASADVGIARFVLASSTSVYGSGSAEGMAARVLDESTPVAPENIYDVSKLAAERLAQNARTDQLATVALRFGRFFFPSQSDYHLRKLSTGLDVFDACQAVMASLTQSLNHRSLYCVASDLPLDRASRERMGTDLEGVLESEVPGFVARIRKRGWSLPPRVGKSVDSSLIRRDLGFRPVRTLARLSGDPAAAPMTSAQSAEDSLSVSLLGPGGSSQETLADAIGWSRKRSPTC
ncbi:NAD-dependent epimerase/dehydratase family protein [Streptomyces prunicolor]|uniref:NAD-dependent epimerase/dehydratase family protein n=1 Tax=Streptomyces prunicolor TaxID=67348 RepID=UPI003421C4F5